MSKQRVDIGQVFQGYSRKLLHDFREGAKTSNLAFDRGIPREKAVREFFGARLPGRYGVGEGLIIDSAGGQSQQCDIVIFDRERTPTFSSQTAVNIWPFESVYAIGQVKSVLTKSELVSAVENVAAYKGLTRRENNLAGSYGFRAMVGVLNPAFGMLIAHEIDPKLSLDEFQSTIESVPRELQLDAYCVISGQVGFRGRNVQGKQVLDLLEGTELLRFDFGDGSLAAFLLMSISLMNGIVLGEQSFLEYLPFLP